MKKLLSLVLTASMLVSILLTGVVVSAKEELPFTDVAKGDWYYEAVESVYASGIMTGKTATTFDPKANMSRAEFVTVLSRIAAVNAATVGYADSLNFTDTDPGAWYADAAGWAVDAGLTKGTSDTTFSPTRQITRQEMAVLIVRFVDYLGEKVPDNAKVEKFADADKIADWAKADIETMRKYGLIAGDQNGNFNPLGNADRASVATIVMRLMPNVSTTYVVEGGKSDYTIVADETGADAAERIQYQVRQQTGAELEIAKTAKSKKAIELVKVGGMTNDSYEIKLDGEKITINASTAEGLYKGASRFLKAHTFSDEVKLTSCAAETYTWTYPIGKLTINGNDIGKYDVVYPAGASENTVLGANDIAEYIEKACGVKLNVKAGSAGAYSIVVKEQTLKVDGAADDLDSFSVKSNGNCIEITGSAARGAMYGCYDFLEDVIGWCFMDNVTEANSEYLSPKDSLDVSGLDYTETSVFEHRAAYNTIYLNEETCVSQDYTWDNDISSKHKLARMEWVDNLHFAHTFLPLTNWETDGSLQPCLSDEKIYKQMLGNILSYLRADPDAELISVTQNDNVNYCTCASCMATYAKYSYSSDPTDGGTAGQMIEYVNRLADEVKKEFPNVYLVTFAYTYTRHAPKDIVPRDNVMVQLCSLEACFNHPLDGITCNESFAKDIADWSAICDSLYIWDYNNNFGYRGCPFPNMKYDVLAGNMALFANNNTIGVFVQGNGVDAGNGEFDRLRWYLTAKLLWNPYMTEAEYDAEVCKFMEAYYGDGWEHVYEALSVFNENYKKCFGSYDDIKETWMVSTMGHCAQTLVDEMESAKLKTESLAEFEAVDCSQMQFDYLLICINFNKHYKDETLKGAIVDYCFELQAKFQKYEIRFSANYPIPNLTEITKAPCDWKDLIEEQQSW